MKPLVDWLSNPHWNLDTGMMTCLLLSTGTKASGDHSCPVPHCFEEFTSHQLDLRRPTVHADLALKANEAQVWCQAPIVRCLLSHYLESSKPTHLLYFQPYSSAAATPTEWQLAPDTRVTLLLPDKECAVIRRHMQVAAIVYSIWPVMCK